MLKWLSAAILVVSTAPVFGQAPRTFGRAVFFATPAPADAHNGVCSDVQPCSPQGAYEACNAAVVATGICLISLADGEYVDPGLNVYYYRYAGFQGNCNDPSRVRLIGTKAGPLIWVQDHAIGVFSCMSLEARVSGVTGIAGRQHVIVDYSDIIFGSMPGGSHVNMTEFSIASCGGKVVVSGDAAVHAAAVKNSIINLPCEISTEGEFSIENFVAAQMFSTIDAAGVRFTGSYTVEGTDCLQFSGLVLRPQSGQAFPGSTKGNCP